MYRLNIKLKQHSPLIHFQHNQEGATLRATEVKPKLDRFLLIQLGKANVSDTNKSNDDYYNIGVGDAKEKGWFIGDTNALDYRMRIACSKRTTCYPFKYINIDDKYCLNFEDIEINISSFCISLLEKIEKNVAQFFIVHNFGYRQSKGYGSFTVSEINGSSEGFKIDPKSVLMSYYGKAVCRLLPDEGNNSFNSIKKNIDSDYKYIKSGTPKMKNPLLLRFFGNSFGWEKEYLKVKLNEKKQETSFRDSNKSFSNYRFIRPILGLADNYDCQWKKKVSKESITVECEDEDIKRFQSAIIFKVIENKLYICFRKKEEVELILEKKFNFTHEETSLGVLCTPSSKECDLAKLYDHIIKSLKQYQ